MYAFDLARCASRWPPSASHNAQGEKYLTDVVGIAHGARPTVRAHRVDDVWQTEGVNDRVQLARLGAELNRRTLERVMRDGATVVDPATTWIDATVTVGTDTVIRPHTQIHGASTIGADCVIGPDTTLEDVEVGDGATIVRTQALLAVIGPGADVGPFSYLRPGTELGAEGQDRRLRRDEERADRRRGQGPAPHVCG